MAPAHRRAPHGALHFISLLIITVLLLATSAAHALTPATLWSQRFGSSGQDVGTSVALDFYGNVYLAGTSPARLTSGVDR